MEIDTIIVGQGIAGSVFAHHALELGHPIMVLDTAKELNASRIAAGLINPITGRKYVKAWRYEEIIKDVISTYAEIESKLGDKFLNSINIHRVFHNFEEEERWILRSDEEEYKEYLSEEKDERVERLLSNNLPYGMVKNCYQLNMGFLLQKFQNFLINLDSYRNEVFDYTLLQNQDGKWHYKDIRSKNVVFCEGSGLKTNPFFPNLPIFKNKGEILTVDSPHYPSGLILKKKFFSIPIDERKIWYGSVDSWDEEADYFTEGTKSRLEQSWKKNYTAEMTILEEKYAFRLAVQDRRPLVGEHQIHNNMYILNGFGAKGASLAPFCSKILLNFIQNDSPILKEIDIKRYS